jgi:hypothetical protein
MLRWQQSVACLLPDVGKRGACPRRAEDGNVRGIGTGCSSMPGPVVSGKPWCRGSERRPLRPPPLVGPRDAEAATSEPAHPTTA